MNEQITVPYEEREFCAIQRISTGKIHLVYAGGGPADGSLYGFDTLCGYRIKQMEQWIEFDAPATCKRCLRITAQALGLRAGVPGE